jgi:hypothetical protein
LYYKITKDAANYLEPISEEYLAHNLYLNIKEKARLLCFCGGYIEANSV